MPDTSPIPPHIVQLFRFLWREPHLQVILLTLHNTPGQHSAQQIARYLTAPHETVSLKLKRLSSMGMVTRPPQSRDWQLTSAGHSFLSRVFHLDAEIPPAAQPAPRAEKTRPAQPAPLAEHPRPAQPTPLAENPCATQPTPRAENPCTIQPAALAENPRPPQPVNLADNQRPAQLVSLAEFLRSVQPALLAENPPTTQPVYAAGRAEIPLTAQPAPVAERAENLHTTQPTQVGFVECGRLPVAKLPVLAAGCAENPRPPQPTPLAENPRTAQPILIHLAENLQNACLADFPRPAGAFKRFFKEESFKNIDSSTSFINLDLKESLKKKKDSTSSFFLNLNSKESLTKTDSYLPGSDLRKNKPAWRNSRSPPPRTAIFKRQSSLPRRCA